MFAAFFCSPDMPDLVMVRAMEFDSSPLSALTVFVVCMPGVFLAGRASARWLGGSLDVRSVVAPGLSISIWLLAVHVAGLVSRSFRVGFIVGTLGVAIAGVSAWILERRRRLSGSDTARLRIPRRYWIGAIASTCLMTPMFVLWCMHDESIFLGHWAVPSQMLNGVYPPRYSALPNVLLRYHYGFDLLVACTSILTRLRLDHAIDFVTIPLYAHTFLLLCVLGRRIVGRNENLCAFIALFGAGLPMAIPGAPLNVATMLGMCQVEALWLNPPVVSYFMQHPWTLGLPIALCTTLVAMDSKSPARRRSIVVVLLLVMLSLSQIVLFASLCGALLVRGVFQGHSNSMLRRLASGSLMLVVVAVLAYAMGGFFTPLPGSAGIGIIFRPGVVPTFKGNLLWFACTFGFTLPLGLAGFFFIRRERAFFATLLAGTIAILLFFHYDKTWDIVKFGVISAVVLGFLSSATISRIATIRPHFLSFPFAIALVVGSTVAGVAHPVIYGANPPGIPPYWTKDPPLLAPADVEAVTWLRARLRVGEIVYRHEMKAIGYAVWGGIPHAQIHTERTHAVDPKAIVARDSLLQRRPSAKNAWRKEGIRYFVLSPADEQLLRLTAVWEQNGQAKTVWRSGSLRIVEIFD